MESRQSVQAINGFLGYVNRIGEQLGVEFGEWMDEYPRFLWDPDFDESGEATEDAAEGDGKGEGDVIDVTDEGEQAELDGDEDEDEEA